VRAAHDPKKPAPDLIRGGNRFSDKIMRSQKETHHVPARELCSARCHSGGAAAFENDLSIDEAGFRKHLRDVAAVEGLSGITINAHSTEVASCTFDEQRRVLDIAQDEIGARLPLINGVWADGSQEAARIAKMAAQGGASALLVFPPAPFTLGQSPAMALAHFKRIADATDLPLIVFQYPLATGQGYPKDTLLSCARRCRPSAPSRIGSVMCRIMNGTSARSKI